MKTKKNKLLTLLAVAFPLMLVSCLNDSDYQNGLVGMKPGDNNFVEVHLTTGNNSNISANSFKATDVNDTIKLIPVHLTTVATSDVTVTYTLLDGTTSELADSLLTKDGFTLIDNTVFQVLNTDNKVVIPAGQSTGYIQVKFNPSHFTRSAYFIGVRLTAVTGGDYKLSNLTDGYVKYIKNILDGHYANNGTMVDYVSASLGGYYPADVNLVAQDGFSVAYFDNELEYYGHLITSGADVSYYGSFAPVFKLDADNNVISVKNYFGQPAPNGRKAELDATSAGVVNKYDPATKTLKVTYWMVQAGVYRTHFDEIFTFLGPR